MDFPKVYFQVISLLEKKCKDLQKQIKKREKWSKQSPDEINQNKVEAGLRTKESQTELALTKQLLNYVKDFKPIALTTTGGLVGAESDTSGSADTVTVVDNMPDAPRRWVVEFVFNTEAQEPTHTAQNVHMKYVPGNSQQKVDMMFQENPCKPAIVDVKKQIIPTRSRIAATFPDFPLGIFKRS